jgi:hypothetical protein
MLVNAFKFIFVLVIAGVFMPSHASEKNELTSKYFTNSQKVGEARMTYLFWDVYDATLYAPQGQWRSDMPFALQLSYLRKLHGEAIAERSIDEIRKQGFEDDTKLSQWYQSMRELFPDVTKGQSLTGIADQSRKTHFYLDDQLIGSIDDPLFTQYFFDIWLSEQTSQPKMRKQLLGEKG